MSDKVMILETDRLLLRSYCKEDLQDLYEYLSDEAVVLKENNKMIGNVYLGKREFESLELGYVFNKQYWGEGYAKESCEVLFRKAFSEGVHRIFVECAPCNTGSWKLLERLGFIQEAHFKKNVYFRKDENGNPIWKDTFVYSLLSHTYSEGGADEF